MRTHREAGLSLIELMIAITLGLLVLAGLTTVFVSASESQRELQRSAQQIENGRYGMDVLTQDLHHAGYYGRYAAYTDVTTVQDPCITGNEAALAGALGVPVQGFVAASQGALPSLTGSTCSTYLPSANLQAGSDVLVIRRAETTPVAIGTATTNGEVYMQADPVNVDIQFGGGVLLTSSAKASGGAATILQKDGTAAPVRKYHVHIYFVAPCSVPAGGGSVCTGSGDDSGSPIPTLKRLELTVSGGARTFQTVPIAEGIEALKIEYGIDNSPSTADANTGRIGDGAPDICIPNSVTATPAAADWPNVVSAKVWLVARSPQTTPNYSDAKTYAVATASTSYCAGANPGTPAGTGLAYGPYSDGYKRHSFYSDIRLVNLSSRREIPP